MSDTSTDTTAHPFVPAYDECLQRTNKRIGEMAELMVPAPKWKVRKKRRCSDEHGAMRMQKARDTLNLFDVNGWQRDARQQQFHDAFLRATALRMYKDDAVINTTKIMKDNEWSNLKQQVGIGECFAFRVANMGAVQTIVMTPVRSLGCRSTAAPR